MGGHGESGYAPSLPIQIVYEGGGGHCDKEGPHEVCHMAEDALAAPRLTWSKEKPSKAGWYWMSSIVGGSPSIMKIIDGDDMLMAIDDGRERPVQAFNKAYQWAGPLTPPEEKA